MKSKSFGEQVASDLPWVAFVLVAAVAIYIGAAASQAGFSVPGIVLCCLAVISLAAVPRLPIVALCTFVLAAYALPRYGDRFAAVLELNLLDWISALAIVGWAVWAVRERAQLRFTNWLTLTMAAFVLWAVLTMIAAWARGEVPRYDQWHRYDPWHHPTQYFQGMALFLIAAHILGERASAWWFLLLLCIVPSLQALQSASTRVYLDSDLPLMSAMILPAALLGATSASHWALRIAFGMLALDMLRIIALAQNRGAAVGLACAVMILWWNSRHRLRWALAGVPTILVTAWLLVPQGYIDRFRVLWDPQASHQTAGLDRATVRGRLVLWDGAIRMVADHPILGVGAGNYSYATEEYLSRKTKKPAHSSVLNVAAEMGVPGALLYVALFVGAVLALQRVVRSARPEWPKPMARTVQAALVAYLAGGLFMSRQDMQFAYLLLGWTAALLFQSQNHEAGMTTRSKTVFTPL